MCVMCPALCVCTFTCASKVKRLVEKWIRILRIFDRTGVISETSKLLTKAHFTHKFIYAYLPLFISSWILQEHWESDLFDW
jgi:hypothetical protein